MIETDPRWASWNLGVFVCIRCSGIHRGMGTHISRVKSVDLDSWTDEQLQSILSWGNARANKYWEAKLAAGHAPSEAKIENFIRTKYELKRWVMDGPMPDPATLDADADDDVPLSLVKEKQAIEKKENARKASIGKSSRPPEIDLIGGSDPAPPRASSSQPAAKAAPAPPKTTTKDSLLGLDFLGESAAPPRPASTPGVAAGQQAQSRPDLKQSILSLYASAPKPPPQPQQNNQQNNGFGGMASPQSQGSAGGFNDAFSSLSLSNPTSPKPPAVDPFAGLGGSSRATPQMSSGNNFGGLSGGSFFDAKPSQPPPQNHQKRPSAASGFGSFTSPTSPPQPLRRHPHPPWTTSSTFLLRFRKPHPHPYRKPHRSLRRHSPTQSSTCPRHSLSLPHQLRQLAPVQAPPLRALALQCLGQMFGEETIGRHRQQQALLLSSVALS